MMLGFKVNTILIRKNFLSNDDVPVEFAQLYIETHHYSMLEFNEIFSSHRNESIHSCWSSSRKECLTTKIATTLRTIVKSLSVMPSSLIKYFSPCTRVQPQRPTEMCNGRAIITF